MTELTDKIARLEAVANEARSLAVDLLRAMERENSLLSLKSCADMEKRVKAYCEAILDESKPGIALKEEEPSIDDAPKWRSFEDETPPKGSKFVAIYNDRSGTELYVYDKDDGVFYDAEGWEGEDFSYVVSTYDLWIPAPEGIVMHHEKRLGYAEG